MVTVVKHKGAHVINGLESPFETCKFDNTGILHKLDGTWPTVNWIPVVFTEIVPDMIVKNN